MGLPQYHMPLCRCWCGSGNARQIQRHSPHVGHPGMFRFGAGQYRGSCFHMGAGSWDDCQQLLRSVPVGRSVERKTYAASASSLHGDINRHLKLYVLNPETHVTVTLWSKHFGTPMRTSPTASMICKFVGVVDVPSSSPFYQTVMTHILTRDTGTHAKINTFSVNPGL